MFENGQVTSGWWWTVPERKELEHPGPGYFSDRWRVIRELLSNLIYASNTQPPPPVSHGTLLGHLGPVTHFYANLPHRVDMKIKWMTGEQWKLLWVGSHWGKGVGYHIDYKSDFAYSSPKKDDRSCCYFIGYCCNSWQELQLLIQYSDFY